MKNLSVLFVLFLSFNLNLNAQDFKKEMLFILNDSVEQFKKRTYYLHDSLLKEFASLKYPNNQVVLLKDNEIITYFMSFNPNSSEYKYNNKNTEIRKKVVNHFNKFGIFEWAFASKRSIISNIKIIKERLKNKDYLKDNYAFSWLPRFRTYHEINKDEVINISYNKRVSRARIDCKSSGEYGSSIFEYNFVNNKVIKSFIDASPNQHKIDCKVTYFDEVYIISYLTKEINP